VEYYSAIEKDEVMLFVGKWIELEIIMLSKISQAQKSQVSHAFTHMENLGLKLIIIIIMIIIIELP
jgi:hypothetical protein